MKENKESNKNLYGVSYLSEDFTTGKTDSYSNVFKTEQLRNEFIAEIKGSICDIYPFELTVIKDYGKDYVIRIQYSSDENWRRIFYTEDGIIYKYNEKHNEWKQYIDSEEITELIRIVNKLIKK